MNNNVKKSRSERVRAWVALGVVLVGAAAFVGWRNHLRPLDVPVVPVRSDIQEQVFGLGVTGARVQSNVGFKLPGVLIALAADQGDEVRAGTVLARLDARDVEAQLGVAAAAIAQAQGNVLKARADITSAETSAANASQVSARDAALVDSGLVSREQAQTDAATARVAASNVEVARSELAMAQAAVQAAQAQQAAVRATLEQYTLRAPFDARVVTRNLELGAMPNPGQPVFTLVQASSIWVVAYVDERLAGVLRVGQPAQIVLRSRPGQALEGRVARIETQSDATNEERIVDVAFDRVPADIHLAEQAEVRITTGRVAHAPCVPQNAISAARDGHGTVWTVENGRLAPRSVVLGPQLLDGTRPVLGGLPEGAQVVAAPLAGLRAGRRARPEPGSAS